MQSSSTSANPEDQQEVSEINITPLADVTLVLLIILMLLSPLAMQSMIQVQAAQAVSSKAKAASIEKPLFVDVTSAGFTINGKMMDSEYELFRALQRNLTGKRDKTVLISSESDVKYETVVRVLDLVKQSGAKSLSLVPRKKETPST